uniref:TATA-box binding protein associated factor 15 n=1 Tax=Homo sapiens TaxID=9606 RepID=A0A075B7F2_HUMAN
MSDSGSYGQSGGEQQSYSTYGNPGSQGYGQASQVIHSPMVVMRIKSRAHIASNHIITRDSSKTWNHQEAKVEEHLPMTSQTMVNKIHMTSSQAMINIKAHMMSSQIMISSMIPIVKTSSPIIHKGKTTATTHKMTVVM